jgi:hypothetical protein
MDEKTFEDIICKYPDLIEADLKFLGRQVFLEGKRIDILLEDMHKQKLILELKKGTILRTHIAQLLDYEGYFVAGANPDVRVMLVGNRVPENLRRSLDHHGFEWRELSVSHIGQFLEEKGDDSFTNRINNEDPLFTQSPGKSAKRQRPVEEVPVNHPDPSIDINSSELITKILQNSSYEKFRTQELPYKMERERQAWDLLIEHRGNYTKETLNSIFNKVDSDTHNRRWFGTLLAMPNRNLIFQHDMEFINKWIEQIAFSDTDKFNALNICLTEKKLKGARSGLATLLLYLSKPDAYNIWFPATEKALVHLGMGTAFHGKDFGPFYKSFNETAIRIRDKYKVLPQEVDWILSFIPYAVKGKTSWYY